LENNFFSNIKLITRNCQELELAYALVGAFAVGVRARPRATKDIDFAVAVDSDKEAETIVFGFQNLGYKIVAVFEHSVSKCLTTVRLLLPGSKGNQPDLDLMFAISGIEKEVVANATSVEIVPTVKVPVATTGHLIALKILSCDDELRPNDRSDLLALFHEAISADINIARSALDLMQQRGYGNKKDLQGLLNKFLKSSS